MVQYVVCLSTRLKTHQLPITTALLMDIVLRYKYVLVATVLPV